MPRRLSWEEKALDVDASTADALLDALSSFDIVKSQTMACTICADADHKMRYRLLACASPSCSEAGTEKCGWREKIITCLESGHASIFAYGAHASAVMSPRRKNLNNTQKAYCRELADNHLRLMRIRHALSRKFGTPLEDVAPLKTIQNFVSNYSRTCLENHDHVDQLRAWVHERAYTGLEAITEPFTFGWQLDNVGKPVVGNGSDDKPFIVGLSTKALVMRLMVPPASFILRLDATYKMSQCGYPVLVVGISDRSRRFHLVALFVISQETQPVFQAALSALRRLYYWVTAMNLQVNYAMADGDKAQCNALAVVFGDNPDYKFLMCYFHVMKKVMEALQSFPSGVQALVLREMYDLHFTRTESSFLEMRDSILRRWLRDDSLLPFGKYMLDQWLSGWFTKWQAFHTPSGFATTNNPVETFNAST